VQTVAQLFTTAAEFLTSDGFLVRFVRSGIALAKGRCWWLTELAGIYVCMRRVSDELKAAVGQEIVAASAPIDGIAEESCDPDAGADQVLKGNEPPSAAGERIVQNLLRRAPCGQSAKSRSHHYQGPQPRRREPEQQRERKRFGEDLAPVACRARAAGAARPAQAMAQIIFEGLASDAVLDYAGREDHAVSELGGAVANYEIFGEVMAKLGEAAHLFDYFATGGEGWTEGEIHLADQPRYQHARQEFRVHADGLEPRPKSLSGHGAVRAGDHTYRRVA